jgi:hypothetical protein
MLYLLITGKKGSEFCDEFETKKEAITAGNYEFRHLEKDDIKNTDYMYILKSVNPDPDAPNHYDGDIVKIYIDNTN